MIRKARISDAIQIQSLIKSWAKEGKVLERSLNHIYDHIRDYWVFEKNGKLIGCCGLHVVGWNDLAEVKSLVVAKRFQRQGIGRQLVNRCIEEAAALGVKMLFALTFVPSFFKEVGFKKINKKNLPHKIWSDCIECIYFPDCKEEAVALKIKIRGGKSCL